MGAFVSASWEEPTSQCGPEAFWVCLGAQEGWAVGAMPRGGKLHLRVHACVTVCEHLVGGGGEMHVRLCSLGPPPQKGLGTSQLLVRMVTAV